MAAQSATHLKKKVDPNLILHPWFPLFLFLFTFLHLGTSFLG